MTQVQSRSGWSSGFAIAVAIAATLALLLAIGSGTASAAETKFCYGKNLEKYLSGCSNGTKKNMYGVFGNSSDQPVCVYVTGSEGIACSKFVNEGVYLDKSGELGEAAIFNWGSGPAKVYGVFWDGAAPPEKPRTWHYVVDDPKITTTDEPAISDIAANRLDVFTRDASGNLIRARYLNGSGWTYGQAIGLNIASAPSSVSWDSGRIDVVARMSDNTVGHWFCASNCTGEGAWNYDNLGGNITGKPAISSWGTNRLDVFAKGAVSGQLVHKWWGGFGWNGWEGMGGYLESSPDAVSWGYNRIDVVAAGPENGAGRSVWHWYWYGSNWAADNLGGEIVGAPTISSWGENRLDVFARSPENTLVHSWYGGAGWNPWEYHGGLLTSSPDATSWGVNRIDVIADTAESKLARWWYGS